MDPIYADGTYGHKQPLTNKHTAVAYTNTTYTTNILILTYTMCVWLLCVVFVQASSPACTELEINVMDWLCKALGLPSFFLHHHPDSIGGGIIQVAHTHTPHTLL